MMKRRVTADGLDIYYDLIFKRIKNINLHVNGRSEIYVSAPYELSAGKIDNFVISRADFILKVIGKNGCFDKKIITPPDKAQKREFEILALDVCRKAYNDFCGKYKIDFPVIKFRYMTGRWGSCNKTKQTITLNYALYFTDIKEFTYVVYHEFTHLIVFNHSAKFYKTLGEFFPDWKESRKKLKGFVLIKHKADK